MTGWREIYGEQNLRMAAKMLEQQGEVNEFKRQRGEVLAYLQQLECGSCGHTMTFHRDVKYGCSSGVNNSLGPCGCKWSHPIAEDIANIYAEKETP